MKKTKLLLALTALTLSTLATVSCGKKYDVELTVYNWEDYIATGEDGDGEKTDTSVIEDFQAYYKEKTGKRIKVNYQTFSTNEDMYNEIKLGSLKADLICPSDYMIQKMIKADMLETLENTNGVYKYLPNYNNYGSPYLKSLYAQNNWTNYSIPYMWGTMGFTYNPAFNNSVTEDTNTWEILWNTAYKGKITVKDSVRDTYFTAVLHVYKDELASVRTQYDNKEITAEQYNAKLTEIFNRCDDDTLAKVKEALISLKSNIQGLEVDDGKNDIVTGKIAVNLAWSGDAVFSLDSAEESDTILNYTIPQEGSNIWFDGWVIPKGGNIELGSEFLDFLCKPSTASKNMDFIGYTPAIAGEEIWNLVNEWYAADEKDADYATYDTIDLSYFFNGTLPEGTEAKITVAERGRQFDAQYPDFDTITRCAIMQDFDSQTDKVYEMWNEFKAK